MGGRELNDKQRLFVEAYVGDAVTAMQIAGYEGDPSYLKAKGEALLEDPAIIEAIQDRSKYIKKVNSTVADRQELQSFWTSLIRNTDPHAKPERDHLGNEIPPDKLNIPLQHRLKAAESLAKSEGMFVDTVNMNQKVSITDVINEAYAIPDSDIGAIEAEYTRIHEQKKLTKQTPPLPPPVSTPTAPTTPDPLSEFI